MKKLFIKFRPQFIVILIVILFFLPNLAQNKLPIPADALVGLYHPWRDNSYLGYSNEKFPVKNPVSTDPILQTYSWRLLVIKSFKSFSLPLWNPYSFSGQPLLANVQSSPFQLLNILFFAIPFKFAWGIQIITPLILTSIFMYMFLKSIHLSSTASVFGAIVLPFSGFFVAWFEWGTVVTTAMWLPLILYLSNKFFEKISFLTFLLLTFAFMQVLVSGHPQTALYVFLFASFYITTLFLKTKKIKTAIFTLISTVSAILISSPQIIPTLEFLNYTNRAQDQMYFVNRQDWFLPIQNLIQIVAPDFFGNPTTNNYWGIWNYAEFISFVGVVPLFFAIISLFKLERKYIVFPIILTVAALLALKNPVSVIPYRYSFPIVSSFQPSRIIFLIDFALAVLSAIGLNYFLAKFKIKDALLPFLLLILPIIIGFIFALFFKGIFPVVDNQNIIIISLKNMIPPLITISALLLVILFSKKLNKKVLISVIFLITLLELFRFWSKFTPFTNSSILFPPTQTTTFLENQQKPFRVLSTDRRIADPNSLIPYKIESVSGYDPLYLKSYANFVSYWQSNKIPSFNSSSSFGRFITPENFDNQITSLINVKYVLTFDEIVSPHFEKVLEEGKTKLYENKNVLERAFFVENVKRLNSENEVLKSLSDKNQSLKQTAFSTDLNFTNGDKNARATLTQYTDQNLQISTESSIDSPLVITNIYYPGWKAYVDQKPANIYRVNSIFQSVMIPKGKHTVDLVFFPNSFIKSMYLFIFGIFITVAASFYIWHKKFQL